MLHVCGALFVFVNRDRFVNPRHDPDCPAGGMSFWTTHQGGGNVVENIATVEGTITVLEGANARTCSSPRRNFFLHALSFECTSKLCATFINQFSDYFHI